MKKINLEIEINAAPEVVWDSIVNDAKFRKWTTAFMEGSFFEGSWNKGDAIRFLATNSEGKKEGMVSEIAESIFPKYISIRHLGFIFDGKEDTTSDKVKAWAPSYENYTMQKLEEKKTLFKLDMDSMEEYHDEFMKMWPNALKKLKQVSEQ